MDSVRTLRRRALLGMQPEMIAHMDTANDQHIAVFLDFAGRLRREIPFSGWDLARFQRTAKGAGQSARSRGDQVVERRVVWLVDLRVDAIVLRDGGMDTEEHGI